MSNSRLLLVCQQTCEHRDTLKAQLEANRAETEQLRLELEQSRRACEEAKKMQAQQGLEKLKAALANAIAHLRSERAAKQEALKER